MQCYIMSLFNVSPERGIKFLRKDNIYLISVCCGAMISQANFRVWLPCRSYSIRFKRWKKNVPRKGLKIRVSPSLRSCDLLSAECTSSDRPEDTDGLVAQLIGTVGGTDNLCPAKWNAPKIKRFFHHRTAAGLGY